MFYEGFALCFSFPRLEKFNELKYKPFPMHLKHETTTQIFFLKNYWNKNDSKDLCLHAMFEWASSSLKYWLF